MLGRRSVTSLVGRLSDRVARTARRWRSRTQEPVIVVDGLSTARRRELAQELGYLDSGGSTRPDPAPPLERDPAVLRTDPEEPGLPRGPVEHAEPPFIGLTDLDEMDPPPLRGELILGPDQDEPVHAVAERIVAAPSEGPEEEVIDNPDPDIDPFDRYDEDPA